MKKWLTENRAIKLALACMLTGVAGYLGEEIKLVTLIEILLAGLTAIFLRKGMAPERNVPGKKGDK